LSAAALMPYEIYFYSSGAVEEGWDPKDMIVNRANAFVGFGLGGLISVGILVASAQVLKPAGISPTSVGTVALVAQQPYAELGLILALVGILFAVGGATVDTAFSAAYNLAQHQAGSGASASDCSTSRASRSRLPASCSPASRSRRPASTPSS
jgi:manganese transport protein